MPTSIPRPTHPQLSAMVRDYLLRHYNISLGKHCQRWTILWKLRLNAFNTMLRCLHHAEIITRSESYDRRVLRVSKDNNNSYGRLIELRCYTTSRIRLCSISSLGKQLIKLGAEPLQRLLRQLLP